MSTGTRDRKETGGLRVPSQRGFFGTILVCCASLIRSLSVRLRGTSGVVAKKGSIDVRRSLVSESNRTNAVGAGCDHFARQRSPLGDSYDDEVRSDDLCVVAVR